MKRIIPMIQHNQGFFTSFGVSLFIVILLASCHFSAQQKRDIVTVAAETAISVSTHTPINWEKVGFLIGSLLGGGAVIDNRRKDVLIKTLKKANAVKDEIISGISASNGNDSS